MTSKAAGNSRRLRALEELLQAISANNLRKVERMIAEDRTLLNLSNEELIQWRTGAVPHPPVLGAVLEGRFEILQFLVAQGGDVNGGGPLHIATFERNLLMMELLLENGAMVEAWTPMGSPLACAAMEGYVEGTRLLLDYGASTQFNTGKVMPSATKKIINSHKPQQLRLPKRARPETASPQQLRKLLLAIQAHDLRAVRSMLENDEVILNPTIAEQRLVPMDGANQSALPLLVAVDMGNLDMVRLLLEHGAEINIHDDHGVAPLYVAGMSRVGVTQLLLDYGGDVHVINRNGETALMLAAETGNEDTVRLLLDFGAGREVLSARQTNAADEVRNSVDLSRAQKASMIRLLETYTPTPRFPTNAGPRAPKPRAPPAPSAAASPTTASGATAPVKKSPPAAAPSAAAPPPPKRPGANDPGVEAKRNQGNESFKKGDFQKAIKFYTQAGDAKSIANRIQCYNKLEQYSLAVKDAAGLVREAGTEDSLPQEILDKVYSRLGLALYEIAERMFLYEHQQMKVFLEREDVRDSERARQMDLFRTSAHYLALSGSADPIVIQSRTMCYRRILARDAWVTADVSAPYEELPLIESLSVCMLCWKENDSTRLVRSNLVPNPVLNLMHTPPTEPFALYPPQDSEGVAASVASVRRVAPQYRRCMYCNSCDQWMETYTEGWLTKFLVEKVHNASYEDVFEVPQLHGSVALGRVVLSGALLARHGVPYYIGFEQNEHQLADVVFTARGNLLATREAAAQGVISRLSLQHQKNLSVHIDEDAGVGDWPVRRRWFGAQHYFSAHELEPPGRSRVSVQGGHSLWIQLGLFHVMVITDADTVTGSTGTFRGDRMLSLGTRREIAARNDHNNSFTSKVHARMLRLAWHPTFDRPGFLRALDAWIGRSTGTPFFQAFAGRTEQDGSSLFSTAQRNLDAKRPPAKQLRLEDGFAWSPKGVILNILPIGATGKFPPPPGASQAFIGIADNIFEHTHALSVLRPGGAYGALGYSFSVMFLAQFSTTGHFVGIYKGDGGPIDEFITTLWLRTQEIVDAIEDLWRQALAMR